MMILVFAICSVMMITQLPPKFSPDDTNRMFYKEKETQNSVMYQIELK